MVRCYPGLFLIGVLFAVWGGHLIDKGQIGTGAAAIIWGFLGIWVSIDRADPPMGV